MKENRLRILFLTDTHYTGTNILQKLREYNMTAKEDGKPYGYILDAGHGEDNSLKWYNGYTREYDVYGWTSDEKLQSVVDELCGKYENGEFDAVFFLGDQSMNDHPYGRFETNNALYKASFSQPTWPVFGDPERPSCEGFWESPDNGSYLVKKLFLDQLAKKGIPYFCANGNHDYLYTYSKDKSDLDYTPFEKLYHYAELFGHRSDSDNGSYLRGEDDAYIHYSDSDSVTYLVRLIRRDGRVRVVSAMTEKALSAFREKHAGDGNCYDYFVGEDSLTDKDEKLAAFLMVNGFGYESYRLYTEIGILPDKDGKVNYAYQTIRYNEKSLRKDFIDRMAAAAKDYPVAYIVGHLAFGKTVTEYFEKYDNMKAVFYGDTHCEERSVRDDVPFLCCGHYAVASDIDAYMNGDVPDAQYFYSRGVPKIYNRIWGDMTRHPWNYLSLEAEKTGSFAVQCHQAFFYQNGSQVLTHDNVNGIDKRYLRATADPARYGVRKLYFVFPGDTALYPAEELSVERKAQGRVVYAGGTVHRTGGRYACLSDDYCENEWRTPKLYLDTAGRVFTPDGKEVGTCDVSGLRDCMRGNEFRRDSVSAFPEGRSVSFNGVTYTVSGTCGEFSGGYLTDEKGDYVYLDRDGHYVFVDPVPRTDDTGSAQSFGDAAYVPYQRDWFYTNRRGENVPLDFGRDAVITDIQLIPEKTVATDSAYNMMKYFVDPALNPESRVSAHITVKDGKITEGEGFCGFAYRLRYSYADGTPVNTDNIRLYPDENGNPVYGIYIPYMEYRKQEFTK